MTGNIATTLRWCLTTIIPFVTVPGGGVSGEVVNVTVGDSVCVGGYVMDNYCIDLGTLLDNSAVRTLSPEGPVEHSVHCLVDVGSCRNSPWDVLVELDNGDYASAWRLDDNELVLAHARELGVCSTCKRTNRVSDGHIRKGYRATILGTVSSLGGGSQPATIDVDSVLSFDEFASACGDVEYTVPNKVTAEAAAGSGLSLSELILMHGALMLIGWGLLLPAGAVVARFGKNLPDAGWFRIHRMIQPFGLAVALVGWIIALRNFSALDAKDSPTLHYPHAVCGMVTMVIGLTQPLNAFVRPHPPKEGEERSSSRIAWEILHKGSGWVTICLAIVTIGMGTTLLPNNNEQLAFQICLGVSIVVLVVTAARLMTLK